jgi:hypothetical protein
VPETEDVARAEAAVMEALTEEMLEQAAGALAAEGDPRQATGPPLPPPELEEGEVMASELVGAVEPLSKRAKAGPNAAGPLLPLLPSCPPRLPAAPLLHSLLPGP